MIGGAGYIGAHVVTRLIDRGEEVVVIDDLSTGLASRVSRESLIVASITAPSAVESLTQLLREWNVSTVYHFAAEKSVERAWKDPLRAYSINVDGVRAVLSASVAAGVQTFVLSSTAAVYGDVSDAKVGEHLPTAPINPYGRSKLAAEWLSAATALAHPALRIGVLRYFNVAGAASTPLAETVGTNLIPKALRAALDGQPPIIYGYDYDTEDGTCERDYVHVDDVALAHLAIADALSHSRQSVTTMNIGSGVGYSVAEVLESIAVVTGSQLQPIRSSRREGDPARVVADITRVTTHTGWRPRRTLHEMVQSTYAAMAADDHAGRP